jgi:hypothetical protein
VFELCAPRRCHASDHGASGIRLPGLGRGFDDGDALALEDGCFLLGATNALEAKTLQFLGWRGPAKSIKTIKKVSL